MEVINSSPEQIALVRKKILDGTYDSPEVLDKVARKDSFRSRNLKQ